MSRSSDPILTVVVDWQRRIHDDGAASDDRRARAHLRRVRTLADVPLIPDYYRFERDAREAEGSIPEKEQYPPEGLVLLAALLPYLKHDTDTFPEESKDGAIPKRASLARVGGMSKPGSSPPRARLSEGRFRRLIASETREEFFGQLARTLRLLEGTASLSKLVNDIRRWYPNAKRHPRRDWARDYYTAALADATPSDA